MFDNGENKDSPFISNFIAFPIFSGVGFHSTVSPLFSLYELPSIVIYLWWSYYLQVQTIKFIALFISVHDFLISPKLLLVFKTTEYIV